MSIRSLILPQKKLHVILLVERQAPHAIQTNSTPHWWRKYTNGKNSTWESIWPSWKPLHSRKKMKMFSAALPRSVAFIWIQLKNHFLTFSQNISCCNECVHKQIKDKAEFLSCISWRDRIEQFIFPCHFRLCLATSQWLKNSTMKMAKK